MSVCITIGVSRKEAVGRDGSIEASCSIGGIEIADGASYGDIAVARDEWYAIARSAVGAELDRLRAAAPPPVEDRRPERPAPAPSQARGQNRDEEFGRAQGHAPAEKPPRNGRELLGWAASQEEDVKPRLAAWGKKKGFGSKIVDWTPEQAAAAYQAARASLGL